MVHEGVKKTKINITLCYRKVPHNPVCTRDGKKHQSLLKNINPKEVIMRSLYCYVSKEGIFIVYIKDFQKPPRFSFIPKNQASSAPCGG